MIMQKFSTNLIFLLMKKLFEMVPTQKKLLRCLPAYNTTKKTPIEIEAYFSYTWISWVAGTT